jgi:mRNA interferase MazF
MRDRPAVVINAAPIEGDEPLLWVLMVTTAANRGWPDDVSLETRYAECDLNVPCVIRTAKISTVEQRRARKLGTLPADLFAEVQARVTRHLGR